MPIESLTANHLDQSGWEPQRQNNGLFRIIGLDSNNPNATTNGQAGRGEGVIELALQSWPNPKENQEVTELDYLNEKRKFAGRTTYDDLSLVINDFVQQDVARMLERWRYLCFNPENGRVGLAVSYKKTCHALLYGPDGQVERRYDCLGVWPTAFDRGDMDMSSADVVKINITLSVDKVIPRTGVNPGGNAQQA